MHTRFEFAMWEGKMSSFIVGIFIWVVVLDDCETTLDTKGKEGLNSHFLENIKLIGQIMTALDIPIQIWSYILW